MTDDTSLKVTRKKLSDYTPDLHNANQGSERGHRFIDDSITEDGVGRSGLVDKNGVVIAGNQTMEVLAANGIEDVIEVETTGKEWVVVKRTDTDLADSDPNNTARRMAYRDNRSVDVSLTWNPVQLQADKEAGIAIVDKLWSPVELEALNNFTPEYTPESSDKKYSQDDIDTAKQQLEDKFNKAMEKEVEIACPECGETFYMRVKDIMNEADNV